MKIGAVMSFFKLASVSTAAGVVTTDIVMPIAVPVFGVPVSVIGAAGIGAGVSLFFGDKVSSKRSLVGQVLGSALLGVSVAVLFADAFDLHWAKNNIAAFSLVVAALIRWFLPVTIERAKELIKGFRLPSGGNEP